LTNGLDQAVQRLAQVLSAENTALAAMDFASAGALLAPKHAAADALAAALRGAASQEADPVALMELGNLAEENRRLLNRAMRVQRRVLDLVARAARASQPVSRYGASGALSHTSPGPRSLAKRI
jgi:hypothetical protein